NGSAVCSRSDEPPKSNQPRAANGLHLTRGGGGGGGGNGLDQQRRSKKNRQTKLVVDFDAQNRVDFLTGFRKRKEQRRKEAQQQQEKLLHEAKLKARKARLDETRDARMAVAKAERKRMEAEERAKEMAGHKATKEYKDPERLVTVTTVSSLELGDFDGSNQQSDEEDEDDDDDDDDDDAGTGAIFQRYAGLVAEDDASDADDSHDEDDRRKPLRMRKSKNAASKPAKKSQLDSWTIADDTGGFDFPSIKRGNKRAFSVATADDDDQDAVVKPPAKTSASARGIAQAAKQARLTNGARRK
ncbi:hypothetical protein CAOG_03355, partial [Capsaspora owczarzaki ATCC 30864]